MTAKVSEIIQGLYAIHTPEEISKMSPDELDRAASEVEEEINIALAEERQDQMIYGDPEHEAYLCSESYEADCKQEQWDWLKNA